MYYCTANYPLDFEVSGSALLLTMHLLWFPHTTSPLAEFFPSLCTSFGSSHCTPPHTTTSSAPHTAPSLAAYYTPHIASPLVRNSTLPLAAYCFPNWSSHGQL